MEQMRFWDDILKNGIMIYQGPFFENVTYEQLKQIYRHYKITPYKVRFRRYFARNDRYRRNPGILPQNKETEMVWLGGQTDYVQDGKSVGSYQAVADILKSKKDDGWIDESAQFFINSYGDVGFTSFGLNNPNMTEDTDITKVFYDEEGRLVREFSTIRPVIIAKKYIMVLKHTPDSKASARSLGTVNSLGIPSKAGRIDRENAYSTTAIRFGDMENFNALSRVSPKLVHRLNALHSTNPFYRDKLAVMLLSEDPMKLHDLQVADEDIVDDTPAVLLGAYLYSMGIEMYDDTLDPSDEDD
jgi:hypothetical protein